MKHSMLVGGIAISATMILAGCVSNQPVPSEKLSPFDHIGRYIKTDTKSGWLFAWQEELSIKEASDHVSLKSSSGGGYCPQSTMAHPARAALLDEVRMVCGMHDGVYEENGWCLRSEKRTPLFYFDAWVNENGPCFKNRGTIVVEGFFPPKNKGESDIGWQQFYKLWLQQTENTRRQNVLMSQNRAQAEQNEAKRIEMETQETLLAKPGTLLCRRTPIGNDKYTKGYKVANVDSKSIKVRYNTTRLVMGLSTIVPVTSREYASEWYKCSK